MEKKMENEMETLGPIKGVYRDITPIMENQMEKNMEHEIETGIVRGLYGYTTALRFLCYESLLFFFCGGGMGGGV